MPFWRWPRKRRLKTFDVGKVVGDPAHLVVLVEEHGRRIPLSVDEGVAQRRGNGGRDAKRPSPDHTSAVMVTSGVCSTEVWSRVTASRAAVKHGMPSMAELP